MAKYAMTPIVKCDAQGCDYNHQLGPDEDMKDYVDKPCPKCGANLCTQQDYDDFLKVIEQQKAVLNMLGISESDMAEVVALAEKEGASLPRTSVHVHNGVVHTKTEI